MVAKNFNRSINTIVNGIVSYTLATTKVLALPRANPQNFSFKFYFTKNAPSLLTTKIIKCKKKLPTAINSKANSNFISVDKLNLSILIFLVKSTLKKLFLQKTFFNDYLLLPQAPNLKANYFLLPRKLYVILIKLPLPIQALKGGSSYGITFNFYSLYRG